MPTPKRPRKSAEPKKLAMDKEGTPLREVVPAAQAIVSPPIINQTRKSKCFKSQADKIIQSATKKLTHIFSTGSNQRKIEKFLNTPQN